MFEEATMCVFLEGSFSEKEERIPSTLFRYHCIMCSIFWPRTRTVVLS